MKTTVEYLDAVRAAHALTSDYQLAKLLGTRQQTISNYRRGKSGFDEGMCMRIADALGIDAAEVLTSIAAERSHDDRARRTWEALAKKLSGVSAALFFSTSVLTPSPSPAASPYQADSTGDHAPAAAWRPCIMLSRLRQYARWLAARLSAQLPRPAFPYAR